MNKSQISEIRILADLGDQKLALINFIKNQNQTPLPARNREFLKKAAILSAPPKTSTAIYF